MNNAREDTVGFIGLGQMGMGMATNIRKARIPMVVFDIDDAKNKRMAELGATVGKSPNDVARQSHIVITMVDTTQQSLDVIVRAGGIIDTAQKDDVVICMSTIDPVVVREMHDILAKKGVRMIEAPVVGMVKGAIEGKLRAYVGGAPETVEVCRRALDR